MEIYIEFYAGLSDFRKFPDQLIILLQQFRGWVMPTKIEEDLNCCAASLIEKLEGKRFVFIEMAGLAKGKYGRQFPTADMHIK